MKLINFSVTNYRSITTAHKITLQNLTVLVGKNNEGKSNLLTALNVAMSAMMWHSKIKDPTIMYGRSRQLYVWERDFPLQLNERKKGLESLFRLNFRLENEEAAEFYRETGIRSNEDIPILVKVGKDNAFKVEVPKKGSSSYNKKSSQVTAFISKRISFNYIQAIRTEGMALNVLRSVIVGELQELDKNPQYIEAAKKITELQQEVLDKIASQLLDPLKVFLPQLTDVKIQNNSEDTLNHIIRNEIDVILDDGLPTSISFKGDGIKSLVTLAILKDKRPTKAASIIAIEEPESHLHSGAIHSLVDVINRISENNQVIITTHNPLFVQQNSLKSNIIVNNGTARSAKSIGEIRSVLGVLPADNLRNASHVFVVEGEDDKIALTKILPELSDKIAYALKTNSLVIRTLGGAGNLAHEISDLKNSMCKYFVLLDNDRAGIEAANVAISMGLLTDANIKFTICNGCPEAEFEDCLRKEIYSQVIMNNYSVDINVPSFRGNQKWSNRMKNTFLSQGARWTDTIEKKVKLTVAESVPEDVNEVLDEHKSGFITGVVQSLEKLIEDLKM